jgi:hypothetical protein
MPALPPVSKVMRLSFQYTYASNSRIFNHLYYSYSGTLSTADATTLVSTAATQWGLKVMPSLSTQLTLTQVQLTDLTSSTAPQVSTVVSTAGGSAGTTTPTGTAMVVSLKIARRFKGGHARIYLPGLTAANLADAEHWNAGALTAIQTDLTNFDTAFTTAPPAAVGTLVKVTVSYFLGFTNKTFPSGRIRPIPTARVTPVVDTVTAYVARANVASQRRRNQQSL